MLNGLILKVTKFKLPRPKHLGTVVKNILGGHHRIKEDKVKFLIGHDKKKFK